MKPKLDIKNNNYIFKLINMEDLVWQKQLHRSR